VGFSKDKRPDLAQVVVGFAVTRTGIPVRCWVWPGNTADKTVLEEVKRDLNGWRLGRVVLVADTGFNSAAARRLLQGSGGHYILGEKPRLGSRGLPAEARRRFVVVRNPEEAERDRKKREDIVTEVERRLGELSQLDGEPHRKAACELRAHKVHGRYVRQTRTGKLRLDKAKFRAEELFDGKFLISSSDDGLSAEDIALGYKLPGPPSHPGSRERDRSDLAPAHPSPRVTPGGHPRHALRRGLADQRSHRRGQRRLRHPRGQAAATLLRAPDTTPQPRVGKTPATPAYPPNALRSAAPARCSPKCRVVCLTRKSRSPADCRNECSAARATPSATRPSLSLTRGASSKASSRR